VNCAGASGEGLWAMEEGIYPFRTGTSSTVEMLPGLLDYTRAKIDEDGRKNDWLWHATARSMSFLLANVRCQWCQWCQVTLDSELCQLP